MTRITDVIRDSDLPGVFHQSENLKCDSEARNSSNRGNSLEVAILFRASLAQWQSACLVNKRSAVRSRQEARNDFFFAHLAHQISFCFCLPNRVGETEWGSPFRISPPRLDRQPIMSKPCYFHPSFLPLLNRFVDLECLRRLFLLNKGFCRVLSEVSFFGSKIKKPFWQQRLSDEYRASFPPPFDPSRDWRTFPTPFR